MKVLRFLVLVAALFLVVAPGRALAQDPVRDRERVQIAIEATDRRIEQAEATVAASDNEQARAELGLARDLQARAKGSFGAGQYPMAGRLTLEARGHADRAIALVRGLPDPDRVWAQLERTREMLDRAGERIQECDDDRARAMLRVASAIQERAQSAAEAGRFLGAMQLTMGARERGLRALRLCRLEENAQDAAERALRRTDEVLAQARDRVQAGAPERVREALGRAVQMQDDASRQFRDGRHEASLRLTLSARALAHRAVRMAGRAR